MRELKPLRECSYRTIRRRLAAQLGIPEADNAKRDGLYMYDYGNFIMVRIYRNHGEKVFEEKAGQRGFPTDELITKLMLIT